MSECLSVQDHSWWQAFVTHTQGVRSVSSWALQLDLVYGVLVDWAILASLVRQMLSCTFLLRLYEEVLETLMLDEFVVINSFLLLG